MSRPKRVVICGGGAIGCAIAYFLSRRGAQPTVIERHTVAGSASGKSGGFLARDWCRGTELDQLARRSFDLHAELAEENGNPWSYSRLETRAGHAVENGKLRITGRIGTPETTAVVEPRAFTIGLMQAAEKHGAVLRHGSVADLMRRPDGAVHGVVLDSGESIDADAVVIAMGPWSILAARWLPLPAVYGYKGHSLVFNSGDATGTEALFLEYREASGEVLTPEIFPRADGTTWVCAISSTGALPVNPADVMGDAGAHERLLRMCRTVSPALAASPIVARQACFRPVTEDSLPLIAPIRGAEGAYVATGHNVWGILNAPATGEAMTELILDGAATHVDLSPFTPDRLPTLDPARLRNSV
ncbi:MAG: FAD-binding oxidoreductase [Enhydrobacter sp.]|nr:FAD-binding oxidoreductase [Enhydrobacter sp.]